MTIYLAGTEADTITPTDGGFTTTAGWYDNSYSRVAARACYEQKAFASIDSDVGVADATGFWVSCLCRGCDSSNASASGFDDSPITIKNSAGDPAMELTSSDKILGVKVYNDSGSNYAASTMPYFQGALVRVDLHCYTSGGSSYAEVWIAGTLLVDVSTAGNNRGAAQVLFSAPYIFGNYGLLYGGFSELIIANEDTRGLRVKTLPPTADGDQTDFVGSYADVDEYNLDASSISSSVSGDVQTFSHAGGIGTGVSVRAFVLGLNAAVDAGNDVDGVVRITSTDYVANLEQAASAGFKNNSVIWDANPATSAAWTGADINGMQFGVKNAS